MSTDNYIVLFLSSRRTKGLSPLTIKWYSEVLKMFSHQYRRLPKKPEPIEIFIASCPGKDERRHGYYRALRCFYHFLEKRHGFANPIRSIEPPKRVKKHPSTFSSKELYTLLKYPHPPIIRAALIFLIDTGCRLGELHSLKPENINETEWGYIAHVSGKTGARQVPISHETYHAIKNVLPFPFKVHWLGELIHRAINEAGLTGSAHKIRHTFATLWDGNEITLKAIMGHSTISTLELYRHLRAKNICMQHNQYSPLAITKGGGYQDTMM